LTLFGKRGKEKKGRLAALLGKGGAFPQARNNWQFLFWKRGGEREGEEKMGVFVNSQGTFLLIEIRAWGGGEEHFPCCEVSVGFTKREPTRVEFSRKKGKMART